MGRSQQLALASLALVVVGVVALSCLAPTEILLDVRTNIPCTGKASWQGVAISVGQPGVDVESRAPVLTTTACTASGEVGTLVIVPTGSDGAEVGIRVVAGITEDPESCAGNGYAGCVVARRTLTYLAHQTQNVVMDLTSDCVGNACDLNHTCVEGSCTDTVTATPPVGPDGGVAGGPVRCGDDGVTCATTGLQCCLEVLDGGARGQCMLPKDCPPKDIVLECDTSSECTQLPDASAPVVCCMNLTAVDNSKVVESGQCALLALCAHAPGGGPHVTFCQDRQPCSDHPCLSANGIGGPYLPGYWYCAPPE